MGIDPFSYDCEFLQDSHSSCWICWEVWSRGQTYPVTLIEIVFIIQYLQVVFCFSPPEWNQDFSFCPDCCRKSKNCRPGPPKDQDRGSVLSKRKKWSAHPSCKPLLPWHPSARFLVVPRVLFFLYRALVKVIEKGSFERESVAGRTSYLLHMEREREVEGGAHELWSR